MKSKTVADVRFVRERPLQRQVILRDGLVPDIVIVRGKAVWDWCTARGPDGRRIFLREDTAAMMLIMARAGVWGDLAHVVLDLNQYLQVRDLISQSRSPTLQDLREWLPDFFC